MMVNEYFKYRKVNYDTLEPFGFKKVDHYYEYSTHIVENLFEMKVIISITGDIETKVIDVSTNEEYILHLIKRPKGQFASKVKEAYDEVLENFMLLCTTKEVYHLDMTKNIIQYVRETYHDELEFLWESSPTTAIFRRKDNKKWYAVLMVLPLEKLGIKKEGMIEIINLKINPQEMTSLLDYEHYFPGFHMNKKSWVTICLDGRVGYEEICHRIDESYQLVK